MEYPYELLQIAGEWNIICLEEHSGDLLFMNRHLDCYVRCRAIECGASAAFADLKSRARPVRYDLRTGRYKVIETA